MTSGYSRKKPVPAQESHRGLCVKLRARNPAAAPNYAQFFADAEEDNHAGAETSRSLDMGVIRKKTAARGGDGGVNMSAMSAQPISLRL
jgi:hypothetical protein